VPKSKGRSSIHDANCWRKRGLSPIIIGPIIIIMNKQQQRDPAREFCQSGLPGNKETTVTGKPNGFGTIFPLAPPAQCGAYRVRYRADVISSLRVANPVVAGSVSHIDGACVPALLFRPAVCRALFRAHLDGAAVDDIRKALSWVGEWQWALRRADREGVVQTVSPQATGTQARGERGESRWSKGLGSLRDGNGECKVKATSVPSVQYLWRNTASGRLIYGGVCYNARLDPLP
jgi:hypothetical protein